MALASEILALQKALNRTKIRQGNVFVASDDLATVKTLGRVMDVTMAWEPINSERDSTGRISTMGFNVVIQITMMQVGDDFAELDAAAHLAQPDDLEDGQNGYQFFISNKPMDIGEATTEFGEAAPDGVVLRNALVQPSPNVNFSGGTDSRIVLRIDGSLPVDRLKGFSTTHTVTFDV